MTGGPTPPYAFIIVGLIGVMLLFLAGWLWGSTRDMADDPLITVLVNVAVGAVLYGAPGFLSGLFWPNTGWKWGLVLSLPLTLMLALSVAFAGYLEVFVRKDLPVLIACITAACVSANIGGRWTARRNQTTDGQPVV